MVESQSDFAFRKLGQDIYLILEVMMYVEYPDMLKYMFEVNRATRSMIFKNGIAIRNGFVNEGLITY